MLSYLFTAVLGLLLVAATVAGIVTASHHSPRTSVGGHSAVVLYGGR